MKFLKPSFKCEMCLLHRIVIFVTHNECGRGEWEVTSYRLHHEGEVST